MHNMCADCQFSGFNDSYNWGAGACLDWGSSMSFKDCAFSDNSQAIRTENGIFTDPNPLNPLIQLNRTTDVRVEGTTFTNSKRPGETNFMSLNLGGEFWDSSYFTDWTSAKVCVITSSELVCEIEDVKTLEAADERDAGVPPSDRVFLTADDDEFTAIKEVR